MSKVNLKISNSTRFDTKDLTKIVEFCLPPGLKGDFIVLIKQNKNWDGTCWPSLNKVEVIIPPDKTFPQIIDINHELPGSYLREVYLNNINEFLVWLLSHELMHILYGLNNNVIKVKKDLAEFIELDEEMLADFYGLANLSKYRRSLWEN
jgi:hypothetical protein